MPVHDGLFVRKDVEHADRIVESLVDCDNEQQSLPIHTYIHKMTRSCDEDKLYYIKKYLLRMLDKSFEFPE